MQEIRFHGRGGQGTVVASILLAKALFKAGYFVQTFPFFGVERRGAPVETYLRFGKNKIMLRSNVYDPDVVVVQDRGLLSKVDVVKGLKKNGYLLLNSFQDPDLDPSFSCFQVARVDANRIAWDLGLGSRTHPIINTAMVGAFAKMIGLPSIKMIEEVITSEISNKTAENVRAAMTAYQEVQPVQPNRTDG